MTEDLREPHFGGGFHGGGFHHGGFHHGFFGGRPRPFGFGFPGAFAVRHVSQ